MAFLRSFAPLREKLAGLDATGGAGSPARDVLVKSATASETGELEGTAPATGAINDAPPLTLLLTPRDKIGVVLALLALYFIWGSTFVTMRFALGSASSQMLSPK